MPKLHFALKAQPIQLSLKDSLHVESSSHLHSTLHSHHTHAQLAKQTRFDRFAQKRAKVLDVLSHRDHSYSCCNLQLQNQDIQDCLCILCSSEKC